ncbi:MAG TPA: hypothetical protein VKV95_14315 [Terriglobia bacterium]|nr:hypothetical protein [Terriglobia bacterium]
MANDSIVEILRPVVDKLDLLGDYITNEEVARIRKLALEIRAIYDTSVERLTSGRVS